MEVASTHLLCPVLSTFHKVSTSYYVHNLPSQIMVGWGHNVMWTLCSMWTIRGTTPLTFRTLTVSIIWKLSKTSLVPWDEMESVIEKGKREQSTKEILFRTQFSLKKRLSGYLTLCLITITECYTVPTLHEWSSHNFHEKLKFQHKA